MERKRFDEKLHEALRLAADIVNEETNENRSFSGSHTILNSNVSVYLGNSTIESMDERIQYSTIKFAGIQVATDSEIEISFERESNIYPVDFEKWFRTLIFELQNGEIAAGETMKEFGSDEFLLMPNEADEDIIAIKRRNMAMEVELADAQTERRNMEMEMVEYQVKAKMLDNILGKDGVMFTSK